MLLTHHMFHLFYNQQMFKQQQKMFQQARIVQSQRLKTIKQLHDQFTKVKHPFLRLNKAVKIIFIIETGLLLMYGKEKLMHQVGLSWFPYK